MMWCDQQFARYKRVGRSSIFVYFGGPLAVGLDPLTKLAHLMYVTRTASVSNAMRSFNVSSFNKYGVFFFFFCKFFLLLILKVRQKMITEEKKKYGAVFKFVIHTGKKKEQRRYNC